MPGRPSPGGLFCFIYLGRKTVRLVLQRVERAEVRVDREVVGEIGRGLLVLAGVEKGDGEAQAGAAVGKLSGLRVFPDADGRMNLDAGQVGGEFLVVSQFTLAGNPLAKGRRPSWTGAAAPEVAEPLVERIVGGLRQAGHRVETGRFGARMAVELVNDGPVTLVLDV
jgi:D-aminoacyl-tRNA deacylase